MPFVRRTKERVWPVGLKKAEVDYLVKMLQDSGEHNTSLQVHKDILHVLKVRQAVPPIGPSIKD